MSDDFGDMNLTATEQEQIPQLPPTPEELGWPVLITDCKKETTDKGQRSAIVDCIVEGQGIWAGHQAVVRMFLDGQYADSSQAKFERFAYNCGLRGKITSADAFKGKRVVVGTKLSTKDPKYTNYNKSWPIEDEQRFCHRAPDSWNGKPNVKDGDFGDMTATQSPAAKKDMEDVPF